MWGHNCYEHKSITAEPGKILVRAPRGLLVLKHPFWGLFLMFFQNVNMYVFIVVFMCRFQIYTCRHIKIHRSPFLERIQHPYGLIKSPKFAKMVFFTFSHFLLVIFTQNFLKTFPQKYIIIYYTSHF